MVTTESTQLTAECNDWRTALRSNRDQLTQCNKKLQEIASKLTDKKVLQDVEHFQNQFHIQLINIHDLRHAIKDHEKFASWEMNRNDGIFSDATWAEHEELHDKYNFLTHTIQQLQTDFNNFGGRFTS